MTRSGSAALNQFRTLFVYARMVVGEFMVRQECVRRFAQTTVLGLRRSLRGRYLRAVTQRHCDTNLLSTGAQSGARICAKAHKERAAQVNGFVCNHIAADSLWAVLRPAWLRME